MYHHRHNSNGGDSDSASLQGGRILNVENSGDERESRSGGEERDRNDDNDLMLHNKPTYLLEHLATFTVNKDTGIVYPADGMRRLLQLEKTTGIWSQKMQLCLDYRWVLIIDYETDNIIERFPASLIQEPTAFTSTDAMELYNNILVFIVAGGNGARSEMHIFQSQSVSAVHLVEDLKNLRKGNMVIQQRESSHMPQQSQQHRQADLGRGNASSGKSSSLHNRAAESHTHTHMPQHHQSQRSNMEQYNIRREAGMDNLNDIMGGMGETDSDHGGGGGGGVVGVGVGGANLNDETSSVSSDKYERDVNVLNHCFDDIEKFIARLQHAAAASRELERRRRNRKTKKKDPGEGLLTLRTRPPHEKEFIDIFAKFKLSFNLLAKLKAHIHDPNAPELVHFLFTPLALIVEASSDTYYESQLPARVVNPLLTREAVNLLINCVTSKETELWRSLGDAWIIPRDQWKEDIGSYHPVFLDGWSPDYLIIDELDAAPSLSVNIHKRHMDPAYASHLINGRESAAVSGTDVTTGAGHEAYDDYDGSNKYNAHAQHSLHKTAAIDGGREGRVAGVNNSGVGDYGARSEITIDSFERSALNEQLDSSHSAMGNVQAITSSLQNLHTRDTRSASGGPSGGNVDSKNHQQHSEMGGMRHNENQLVEAWLDELQAAGAKIVLVTYPRTANNDKELSVVRGEYLEILDDTRKWWKARNIRGQIAHVPHTIVTPYNFGDSELRNQFYSHQLHQQQSNNYRSKNLPATETFETRSGENAAEWVRNKHLGNEYEYDKSVVTAMLSPTNKCNANVTCNEDMHAELKHVLRLRERRDDLDIHKTPTIYIQQNSSPSEVAAWLRAKEFSSYVVQRLNGLNGDDLFAVSKERMIELFGAKEGRRLASQINLQKSVSGYKTARSAEFQAILARARPKSEGEKAN